MKLVTGSMRKGQSSNFYIVCDMIAGRMGDGNFVQIVNFLFTIID